MISSGIKFTATILRAFDRGHDPNQTCCDTIIPHFKEDSARDSYEAIFGRCAKFSFRPLEVVISDFDEGGVSRYKSRMSSFGDRHFFPTATVLAASTIAVGLLISSSLHSDVNLHAFFGAGHPFVVVLVIALLGVAVLYMLQDRFGFLVWRDEGDGRFVVAGLLALPFIAAIINRYIDQRALVEDHATFIDASFKDIVSNPVPLLRDIYAAHGLSGSSDLETRLSAWEREHAADRHGKHEYSLERYHLSEPQISDEFAGYYERFANFLE